MPWSRIFSAIAGLTAIGYAIDVLADETAPVHFKSIAVEPETVRLIGPNGLRGLLVHGVRDDGRIVDLTHRVSYRSAAPKLFTVNAQGVAAAVANGAGEIEIEYDGRNLSVPVQVEQTQVSDRPHFENDVIPILSKYGCNSSGCHGKAEGQNGFKLSVFGFDPQADYDALTKEHRGRRTFSPDPDGSLLLTKVSGQSPHGGGVRLKRGSREYNVLRSWIAAGTTRGDPSAARIVEIRISPGERIIDVNSRQQLRIMAFYSDGRELDVTQIAKYQSNNEGLAAVDANGLVEIGKVPGQVAIMATFAGAVDTFHALIPRKQTIDNYPELSEFNFIDRLVHARLRKLSIIPSELADNAEFMRRAYLGIIATLPTAAEARKFLADSRDDKRGRLVDALLERPEYADYWALKWADLLRVDRRALGHKQARAYYGWIRDSFVANKRHDQFARDILTLKGNIKDAPQRNYYSVFGGRVASNTSQIFLGIRIECAQCHHHPFDRWSQTDYFGMSAFFQQVQRKGTPRGEIMTAVGNPATKHPRTGATIHAYALGTKMPEASPEGDRREVLADWMTSSDNSWFARNLANRMWAHLMGRGLVEPVDDVRDTNPPTNPELLDALAKSFIDSGYDTHELIRTITASAAYQRSSRTNETNAQDEQNYSRALLKRMDAEVLFDAICQVTGVNDKFRGVPHGRRAIQLWDSEVDHYFLKLFGRPTRKTACECERNAEPTVSQVLHVLNAPEINDKLSHAAGNVARIVDESSDNSKLVDELYLTFFARFPNPNEKTIVLRHFKSETGKISRQEAAEDLAWSLMNSLEFLFNH